MGKYDNLTDYEELKKISPRIDVEKWSVLVSIANELAEANRLKRIEILVKYGGYIFIKRDEMVKELKDRA